MAGFNEIINNESNTLISGSSKADNIQNTNYEAENVTIDAGAGADFIHSRSVRSLLNGGAGNDTIYNYYYSNFVGSEWISNDGGHYSTMEGGDGNDSLKNDSDEVLINGGAGNDIIINNGTNVTVDGGAGNDTVAISDDFGMHQGNIFEYNADGGHDVITNFGNEDTIHLVGVSLTGGVSGLGNNNRDIILQVGDGTITIKKGKGKTINILQGDDEEAYQVSSPESVSNDQANVNIVTGNLNDYVENSADGVQISTGGGADYIYNSGANVKIDAGDGADTIQNDGAKTVVEGGAGNDLIENRGENSTLIGGAGDDTINVGGSARVRYANGDGNDVIIGYDSDSTIQITSGKISGITTDGLDVIIKVGNGSLRVKDAFDQMMTIVEADGTKIVDKYGEYEINNVALYAEVNGDKNANKIKNIGDGSTVSAGDGNDTILNRGANVYIDAGAGNDYIDDQSLGETTINGGAGNDTVNLANDAPHIIEYAPGNGNDVIYGFSENDSIKLKDSAAITRTVLNGDDVIFTVGRNTLTVKNGKGIVITFVDEEDNLIQAESYGPIDIDNFNNTEVVDGTDYDDTIVNWAANATIDAGEGADFIDNFGEAASLVGGAGNDSVLNGVDSVTAEGGAGDDLLDNAGNHVNLIGGAGNDYILNSGRRVTIQAGEGDDVIEASSDYGEFFIYDYTDGNDVIYNYSPNDTIQIASGTFDGGEYVTETDGVNSRTDYIATIKSGDTVGTITLKDIGSTKFKYSKGQIVVDGNDLDEPIHLVNNDNANKTFDADSHADVEENSRYYMVNLIDDATVRTGSRNDTVEGSDFYGELFQFGNADGNDVIVNFHGNDTLQALNGSIFNSIVSGNDLIVSIGSAEKYGTVTLKDAAELNFKLNGDYLIVETVEELDNKKSNVKFAGSVAPNFMSNSGKDVTVQGAGGNDTIEGSNYGEWFLFGANDGNDVITNFAENDTIRITNGTVQSHSTDGDDYVFVVKSANFIGTLRLQGLAGRNFEIDALGNIRLVQTKPNVIVNTVDDKRVSGSSGRDLITNSAENVTIAPADGDDTIVGSNFGELIQVAYNHGDNVIANFDAKDSLQATDGTLSTQESGDDLLVNITKSKTTATVLIKNASNIADPFVITGKTLWVDRVETIVNGDDNQTLVGGNERNLIINTGANVTIQGNGGNDTITGSDTFGDTFLFGASDGNNIITNFGNGDLLTVTSGKSTLSTEKSGDDIIVSIKGSSSTATVKLQDAAQFTDSGNKYKLVQDENSLSVVQNITTIVATKNNEKVSGTDGVDFIYNPGFSGVSMQAGGGDDTLEGSAFGEVFMMSYASGDDVITNFGEGDSLKATSGTISSIEKVNDDVLVTIKKSGKKAVGTILLKDGAKYLDEDGDYHLDTTTTLITAEPNITTVTATKDKAKLNGTKGRNHYINSDYERITMIGSAGNDTFEGSAYADMYQFANGNDDNIIVNFADKDSLVATSGTISTQKSGDDVIVSIKKKDLETTTVTLQNMTNSVLQLTGSTLLTAVDNITIDNTEPNVELQGDLGNDVVNNTAENVTITSSKGTDTFTGSDFYGELFKLSSVDGGNVITNFGTNDTIQITKGSIYSTVLSDDGEDMIVKLGKSSSAGKVTLQGAGKFYEMGFIRKSGKYLIFDDIEIIENNKNKQKLNGSATRRTYITNTGNNVTLNGGGSSNDTLDGSEGMKEVYRFAPTGGEDVITNFGKEDTLYIDSGSIASQVRVGNDYIVNVSNGKMTGTVTLAGAGIYPIITNGKKLTVDPVNVIVNSEDDTKVGGESGRDYITNSGKNVTIQAGGSNDTIYGSNYGDMYLFSYASGDDVILNFDKDDTLKATSGTISAVETVDNDVVVTIKKKNQKSVGTITLKDANKPEFFFEKADSTTLIIDYVNVIDNDENSVKVSGANGRDFISNTGEHVTIQAGGKNDTIDGSDLYGEVFMFSYASGDDLVLNFGENDTLQCTSGTFTTQKSGDDVIVTITKSKKTEVGTVTLGGAGDYDLIKKGDFLFPEPVHTLYATKDGQKVSGTTGRDLIINSGYEKVSIQAGGKNDTIDGSNFGEVFMMSYASGDDVVTNFGSNDTLKATSGTLSYKADGDDVIVNITKKGQKTVGNITLEGAAVYKDFLTVKNSALYVKGVNIITNTKDNVKVTGQTTNDGVDCITNTGQNVTIQAGGGNDIITGSDTFGERFQFSYASGDDTITNFSLGDTLQSTSGTLSYKKVGNDYVVTIKKSGKSTVGTITLQDSAENYTLAKSGSNYIARAKSTSAQLPAEDQYWFLDGQAKNDDPLSEIVSTESAVDLPTDFNDVFKQSTVELTTNARHRQKKSFDR